MSHHLDSPLARQDTRLDITDVYLFRGTAGTVFVMNVNSSVAGRIYPERFHPEALYEFKVDTNGDAVADIAYRVRFSASADGPQTATLRRVEGAQAAGTGDGGQIIVESAQVSTCRDARVTEAGEYRQ